MVRKTINNCSYQNKELLPTDREWFCLKREQNIDQKTSHNQKNKNKLFDDLQENKIESISIF